MRRLVSTFVVTGAVLAVAQAAVADLASVPITVISQTLRVDGSSGTTGDVVRGSSVATSWSLSDGDGSSGGTVSSVLTDGEIIFTMDGALSKGGTGANFVAANISLDLSFEIAVPDLGEVTTPIFFQVSRTNSQVAGSAEIPDFNSNFQTLGVAAYASQLLGSFVTGSFASGGKIPPGETLLTFVLPEFLSTDTVTLAWEFQQ